MFTENSIPFDVSEYHKNQFYNLIKTFLLEVDTGDCVELQNTLLNTYLELGSDSNSDIVFTSTIVSSFLAQLKSKWDNYVKFNTL